MRTFSRLGYAAEIGAWSNCSQSSPHEPEDLLKVLSLFTVLNCAAVISAYVLLYALLTAARDRS
ncbi:hypothetical protein ACUHMQ_09700 [Chitinimonas sp. PSY-7]|uniref:hypothetical protein n=1 Tax=Chitinimonas sp. PSY-7 TaxID=3459088 RepID=UPI00403FD142